jgi:hypothetical protein
MLKKITVGFVIQDYNDKGICIGQEFIAGDQVDWENDKGEQIASPEGEAFLYHPFDMVQPVNEDERKCDNCSQPIDIGEYDQNLGLCNQCVRIVQ